MVIMFFLSIQTGAKSLVVSTRIVLMKKNEFDVPVDWGRLSSHKPSRHSKSDKQIYWAKIRMASKKKKFNLNKEIQEKNNNEIIDNKSNS